MFLLSEGGAQNTLAALDVTLYEVVNVATVRWRSQPEAQRLVRLVETVAGDRLVRIDRALVLRSAAFAGDHGLSVYDGAYVACPLERGWQLVSTDTRDLIHPGHAIPPDQALQKV